MAVVADDITANRGEPRSSGPARRAIVRWSSRMFRREWRQQVLLLALLTVAIGATTFALAAAINAPPAATTTINLPGNDARLADDVAALTTAFGPGQVIYHRRLPSPARWRRLTYGPRTSAPPIRRCGCGPGDGRSRRASWLSPVSWRRS